MKLMKKCLGILTMFLVSFFMIGHVSAAGYKIEITNAQEGHTYEAYQIFTGDLSNDKLTLSNIRWGSGVLESFTNGKNANDYASSITAQTATEKARELGKYLSDTVAGSTSTISEETYTIEGLTPGYYLVKDANASQAGNNDSYTEYIVKLVGDTSVTPKSGIPTVDKKIVEGNNEVIYSSKYAVGDEVTFRLVGTMPTNYDSYDHYKYIFHDTLSSGLTYKANSVKAYVDGTEITSGFTVNPNGNKVDIVFSDTKTIRSITKDSTITIEYIATVNSNAVRGLPGNNNTVNIEFSNNPNTSDDPDNDDTGKTPDVITKVYVFDFVFNKIDSKTKEALKGAGFKLERLVGNDWVVVDTITNLNGNVFTFEGLSVGTYKLTETVTPDSYNTLNPITFEVTAEYDEDGLSALRGTVLSFTADLDAGTLTSDIENVRGIVLPFTGGNGTTLFTVIGLSLMIIALIAIPKKKKEK